MPQVVELLLLSARQAVGLLAVVAVGLPEPGVDGLLRRLELAGEVGDGAAGSGEGDELLAERGRIGGACSGHDDLSALKWKIVHRAGSTSASFG